MRTSSHTNPLQEEAENMRKALQMLQSDIKSARDKGYDLGPYLTDKMNMERKLEKLEQELARKNMDQAPQQMQYDKQSVLSTSVVRRRNALTASSVNLVDKTSRGDHNKPRKDTKSNVPVKEKP